MAVLCHQHLSRISFAIYSGANSLVFWFVCFCFLMFLFLKYSSIPFLFSFLHGPQTPFFKSFLCAPKCILLLLMSRVDIVHWLIHQVMAAWVSSGNTASRAVMNVEYIVCGTCSHSSQENISEIQKMCASFPKKLLLFKVSVPFSTMLVS